MTGAAWVCGGCASRCFLQCPLQSCALGSTVRSSVTKASGVHWYMQWLSRLSETGLVESLVEQVTGNSALVSIASASLFRAVSRQPGSASL